MFALHHQVQVFIQPQHAKQINSIELQYMCVSHLLPENVQPLSVMETLQNHQETAGQAAEQTGEPVQFTTPSLLP